MTLLPQTTRVVIEEPHKVETVAPAPSTALRITGRGETPIERERRF